MTKCRQPEPETLNWNLELYTSNFEHMTTKQSTTLMKMISGAISVYLLVIIAKWGFQFGEWLRLHH
jgi:hypothetical protein